MHTPHYTCLTYHNDQAMVDTRALSEHTTSLPLPCLLHPLSSLHLSLYSTSARFTRDPTKWRAHYCALRHAHSHTLFRMASASPIIARAQIHLLQGSTLHRFASTTTVSNGICRLPTLNSTKWAHTLSCKNKNIPQSTQRYGFKNFSHHYPHLTSKKWTTT